MDNKKIKNIGMFWLVLSLVFIIPMNMGTVFADGHRDSQSSNSAASSDISSPSFHQNEEVYSTCGGPPVNVKNSLVLSIVTLCLPGILEKTNDWRQIKCQTIQCTYEAVKNDLDPTFCTKAEGYQTCKYIVGEAFAIPPLSMLEYWRDMIAQTLANPVGAIWSAVYSSAKLTMEGSCEGTKPPILCHVSRNLPLGVTVPVVIITDAASAIQTLKEIFENGFDDFSGGKDYCEGLDKIKKEMEEIIEAGSYDPDDGSPESSDDDEENDEDDDDDEDEDENEETTIEDPEEDEDEE